MDISTFSDAAPRASESRATDSSSKKYSKGKQSLTMDDYFQLLAAQLQYQDSSNPMSNSEMMAQLTQMAMVEAMNTSTQTTLITYAGSMLNKEATFLEVDPETGYATEETTTGIITGVNMSNSTPTLVVNGKEYYLAQLMGLGKMPEKPDDEDGDNSGDGPGGDGDNNGGPDGTDGPGEGNGDGPGGGTNPASYAYRNGPVPGTTAILRDRKNPDDEDDEDDALTTVEV